MKFTLFFTFCICFSFVQLAAQNASSTRLSLSPAPTGTAAMKWEAERHNFGQVQLGDTLTHTFIVTNTGTAPLQLNSVKPGCSCTVADYSKEPIAPGETGFVTASYTAKREGRFVKSVTIQTNTELGSMALFLNGEVVQD